MRRRDHEEACEDHVPYRIRGADRWLLEQPIAHRGLHDGCTAEDGKMRFGRVPENSIGAFARAVKEGIPIELDLHLTEDEVIYVMHDANLKRMTGNEKEEKDLLAADLDQFHLAGTAYTIPTLEQVLTLVQGKVPLLLEIKNKGMAGPLERTLHRMLQHYTGRIAIESFDPLSIWMMKRLNPSYLTGQLAYRFQHDRLPRPVKWFLRTCRMNPLTGPDFIAYDINALPQPFLDRERGKGIALLGWTVRDTLDQQYAERYCDNYIFEQIRP